MLYYHKNTYCLLLKLKLHSKETYGHSLRVARMAKSILIRDGFRKSYPKLFRQIIEGALLHDIGKLDIPASILCKRGKLEEWEMKIIRNHPVSGYEMLQGYSEVTRNIVRYHHKKINGNGYPDLLGPFPKYIQLVEVLDIYDAMSSKRCYRTALSNDEIISNFVRMIKEGELSSECVKKIMDLYRKPDKMRKVQICWM